MSSKTKLSFQEVKLLIEDHLGGQYNKTALANKYNITPKAIAIYLKDNPTTVTEVEKKQYELNIAKESKRIAQIKQKLLDYCEAGLIEGMKDPNKIYNFSKIKDVIQVLDNIDRLNQDKATSINKNINKNTNFDVAKILEQFKTSDQKRAFLRDGLINDNPHHTSPGG